MGVTRLLCPRNHSRREVAVRHDLAALHQPVLGRPVVRDGAVYGADVLPHEDVALFPVRRVAVPRLELMVEQEADQ